MDSFTKLVDLISQKHPFQAKSLADFLQAKETAFFAEADRKIKLMEGLVAPTEIANSFIKMSKDFLREEIRFRKTLEYRVKSATEANLRVYQNSEVMMYYMAGLYASYFLWPNHALIYDFFKSNISRRADTILEIAPGHGLFTLFMASQFPDAKYHAVDISPTSLQLTELVYKQSTDSFSETKFLCSDFLEFSTDEKFDFIVMGEILEHVDNPLSFLTKVASLLSVSGRVFISTCTDSPSIDHVYHFKTVDEIRCLIESAELNIDYEKLIPYKSLSLEESEIGRHTINYCAIAKL